MTARALLVPASLAALVGWSAPARATTVDLVARPFAKSLPGRATDVPMWGFGVGTDCAAPVSAPGPIVRAAPGEPLVFRVLNCLPDPISIVVPALPAPLAPVRAAGRVSSFTHTTAPGTVGTYGFEGPRSGTFLYHSGTEPQVQVQMGLYGALVIDAAPGEAYPGVAYDADALLLFSEVDDALHDAVAAGTYRTPAYPSTARYAPRYFLVNGEPAPGVPPLAAAAGGRVLLRLVNAGLEAHVAEVIGLPVTRIAEDAFPHRPRVGWSALLPPGKTVDAWVAPAAPGRYGIYDRMLSLSGPAAGAGGMLAHLTVEASAGALLALDDAYAVDEDGSLAAPAPGVLANDSGAGLAATLLAGPASGTLAFGADGSFAYTPHADFNGSDSFTYWAVSGGVPSNIATATIAVAPVNDVPVAQPDVATVEAGYAVTVAVLSNDTDADGDPLALSGFGQGANGAVAAAGADLVYTPDPGFVGTDAFTYLAGDPAGASAEGTVTVTVVPHVNQPPVAVDDLAATTVNVPVVIAVIANDRDPDGTVDPASIVIVTRPRFRGTLGIRPDGTVSYAPFGGFRGQDFFVYRVSDAEGAPSNNATVRVNVQ